MTTLHTLIEKAEGEFEKGYYSFRFEYTDKDGKRRFEIGVWNDGMAPEEALRHIARHVSEYEDGRITDFIDNQHFKSFLSSKLRELAQEMAKEVLVAELHVPLEEYVEKVKKSTNAPFDGGYDYGIAIARSELQRRVEDFIGKE